MKRKRKTTRQRILGMQRPNDLGLEAENAVAFSPALRQAQGRPSYAFMEMRPETQKLYGEKCVILS